MIRIGEISRKTKETDICLKLDLDGTGRAVTDTGIGFFDHMLDSFARHGFFDLEVHTKGDLHVDCHHTIEDTGIVLGEAIKKALGDKKGIKRYGYFILPMDEVLTLAAIDLSGRPYFEFDAKFSAERVGSFDTEMVKEFFYAVSYSAGMNLHIKVLSGANNHHIIESIFKAFAKALDMAVGRDERIQDDLIDKRFTVAFCRQTDKRKEAQDMETKQIIPMMLLDNDGTIGWEIYDPLSAAVHMDKCHADGLFIRDMNKPCREQEEKLIKLVKSISAKTDIPMYVGETYTRFEHVKKVIYAGAAKAVLSYAQETDIRLIKEAADRFGEQVAVYIEDEVKAPEEVFRVLSQLGIRYLFIKRSVLKHFSLAMDLYDFDIMAVENYDSAEAVRQVLFSRGWPVWLTAD